MIDTGTICQAVWPVYLMILAGAVVRWVKLVPPGADTPLMGLTVNLLMPCLILDKMMGSAVLRDTGMLAWSAGLGFAGVAAGIGLSYAAGRMLRLHRGSGLRTFSLTTGLQNYGFVAIPVLAGVFPAKDTMGVLFLHNLGVELAMWSLGLMMLQGSWAGLARIFRTGPILAVLAGIVLVLTRADGHCPGFVRSAMSQLGASAIPLQLLLVGMTMSDLLLAERPTARVALAGVVVRLGLLALLLLAAARYFPLGRELKEVLIVQAAMPAAVFPIVLARHYGGHPPTAIQVVVATGAVSLLSIPAVVAWGARWVFGG